MIYVDTYITKKQAVHKRLEEGSHDQTDIVPLAPISFFDDERDMKSQLAVWKEPKDYSREHAEEYAEVRRAFIRDKLPEVRGRRNRPRKIREDTGVLLQFVQENNVTADEFYKLLLLQNM